MRNTRSLSEVDTESRRRSLEKMAGPDTREREVQPRILGDNISEITNDGLSDMGFPAGLDVRSEILPREIGTGSRILSAAAGLVLTSFGMKKRTVVRMAAASLGVALISQGISGKRVDLAARRWLGGRKPLVPIKIHESLIVFRSRAEVFDIWHALENLPHYMRHLADVERLDGTRSKWTFEIPRLGTHLQWISELTVLDENHRLAWRSLPGGDVATAGDVRFEDTPGGKGTILRIRLAYWPPAGKAGRGLSQVFNPAFERLIREDLRRVKFFIEAEEIPTIEGQPTGSR